MRRAVLLRAAAAGVTVAHDDLVVVPIAVEALLTATPPKIHVEPAISLAPRASFRVTRTVLPVSATIVLVFAVHKPAEAPVEENRVTVANLPSIKVLQARRGAAVPAAPTPGRSPIGT